MIRVSYHTEPREGRKMLNIQISRWLCSLYIEISWCWLEYYPERGNIKMSEGQKKIPREMKRGEESHGGS